MKMQLVQQSLKMLVGAGLPVLLTGAPGVGKSDIVNQVASSLGYDVILSHPVVADPTDAKGLPYPDASGKFARFLPYGTMARALGATRPTIWFLDDLGQASPAVQSAFMQLLLARRIDEHVLPDCITFVAATNGKQHRAGVTGLLEPVKSRFSTIIEVEPDLEAWIDWAFSAGLPPELIAFLQFRGAELLHNFEATREMVNSPSPRTWHNVAKIMMAGAEPSSDIFLPLVEGAIGKAAASEFTQFLKLSTELPSIDDVLLYPDTARIPDEISALWTLATALASQATETNFSAISTYATRLVAHGRGEVATYLTRKSVLVNPEVTQTPGYARLLTSEVGELLV